jgi:uncharacterized Fe-S cluster protein YjdI
MENDLTKKYTNNEVTVVWKPDVCIHSTICWKGLGNVFYPTKRPWINLDNEKTELIIEQVKKCPSGALSYHLNEQTSENISEIYAETIVEAAQDGPLLVYGNITIKEANGQEVKKNKVTAFCRCGASGNKPFCDGTHRKINFKTS